MAGITKLRHIKADGTVEEYDIDGGPYGNVDVNPSITASLMNGTLSQLSNQNISFVRQKAFTYNSTIKIIDLPNCSRIGDQAFRVCSSLESVNIPNCITIGYLAFDKCSAIWNGISIPVCTDIGSYAFRSCFLDYLYAPNCSKIGSSAFYGCKRLETIELPNCSELGNGAFGMCESLSIASLPKCTTIGSNAFFTANKLERIELLGSSFCSCKGYPIQSYIADTHPLRIYVPSSLYDTYVSASYWSAFSSRFISV